MATAIVTEYPGGGVHHGRGVAVARVPYIASTSVTYTTATQHTLNSHTRLVRIQPSATAHVAFGTNPTADTSDPYITADDVEYFEVEPGTSMLVSVYDGTS